MIVFNCAHPLTADQALQIETLAGQTIERVIEAPAQFDHALPFDAQVQRLVDSLGLTAEQWQTLPLLIVPPAFSAIAATLLAHLHGRMGYFATIVRLRPVAGATPPRYEVAELINLQAVREAARAYRQSPHTPTRAEEVR